MNVSNGSASEHMKTLCMYFLYIYLVLIHFTGAEWARLLTLVSEAQRDL